MPERVELSLKVKWWVKPFIYGYALYQFLGGTVDEGRMIKIAGRGIVPVVK